MPTLQGYLSNKYPTQQEKEQVREIIINWDTRYESRKLEGGELDLSEYPNLEIVEIEGVYLKSKLTSLKVNNCANLTNFKVWNNQLTHLDLSNCAKLKRLNCRYNLLTKLDLNPGAKLEKLHIYSNNFSEQDLAFLEWIEKGFSSQEVKEWKTRDFTAEQTKKWLDIGLQSEDCAFAAYLTKQGYQSQDNLNLEELRKNCQIKSQKNQARLEKYYPDKETHKIYLNWQLEGILDCGEYKSLSKIFISAQVDRSKFEIKGGFYKNKKWSNKKQCGETYETEIIPCIPAQTWLDQEYPKNGTCKIEKDKRGRENPNFNKKREAITELDISEEALEGNLNLSDFTNLEWLLECWDNCLTNLDLNNCKKLKTIWCSNNQLTTLNLSNLEQLEQFGCADNYLTQIIYPSNPENITFLDISSNKLSLSDLAVFNKFKNLEVLWIGNYNKNKISQGIYNRIEGSLEPLKGLGNLGGLFIDNTDINRGWEYLPGSLEKIQYNYDTKLRPDCKLAQTKAELEKELWKDIHKKFAPKYKKEWLEVGFSKEQTKQFLEEWKQLGIEPEHGTFIKWFLNFKKLDLAWALENRKKFKDWRDKYEKFGTCKVCYQPNTSREWSGGWCQSCNAKHFRAEFNNWTSGNPEIDNFIQKCQLEATSSWNVLEWIPYEKFRNIEHIADGGFGKVYKAELEEGAIERWDDWKGKWKRSSDYHANYKTVALKTLTNSQDLNQDRLQELTFYKMFRSEISNIVPCYGVSKNERGDYVLVMKYMKDSSLKKYLQKNYQNLIFYNEYGVNSKLHFLKQITQGLKEIHRNKLVHRDFHSGNIIVDRGKLEKHNNSASFSTAECRITDLGLSRSADEVDNNQVWGVMPYVAPEVLKGKAYKQEADIYSLGMIMYEVTTGLPPFVQEAHDVDLALKICQGARPKLPEQVEYPQILVDLITKCWDNEPNNRPTAKEVSGIVGEWFNEHGSLKTDTEFYQQYEEAEEYNIALPDEIKCPTYQSSEVWHSKPINTKQITQGLQQMDSGQLNLELNTQLLEKLKIGDTEELTIPDEQAETSLHTQIQIPPKQSCPQKS